MGKISILNDAGTAKLSLEFTGTSNATVNAQHLSTITSDVQSQLNTKSPLASPAFTGTPTIGGSNVWHDGNTAGKVLQVQNVQSSFGLTTTSQSEVALTGFSYTFNKIRPNSKVVCFINMYLYYGSSPASWWKVMARANGTNVTSATSAWGNAIFSNNNRQYIFQEGAHQTYFGQFWDTTNASSVTFTYFIQQNDAYSLTVWPAAAHTFTYMEIAQ